MIASVPAWRAAGSCSAEGLACSSLLPRANLCCGGPLFVSVSTTTLCGGGACARGCEEPVLLALLLLPSLLFTVLLLLLKRPWCPESPRLELEERSEAAAAAERPARWTANAGKKQEAGADAEEVDAELKGRNRAVATAAASADVRAGALT